MSSFPGKAALDAAIKAGNVNLSSNVEMDTMELSMESKIAQSEFAEQQLIAKVNSRARSVIVPTNELDVKAKLKYLGHPETLDDENIADRRERLQKVVARLELTGQMDADSLLKLMNAPIDSLKDLNYSNNNNNNMEIDGTAAVTEQKQEVVYTPASEELIQYRGIIFNHSIHKAKERMLERYKNYITIVESKEAKEAEALSVANLYHYTSQLMITSSQPADTRPLTGVRMFHNHNKSNSSSSSSLIASHGLGSMIKVWDSSLSLKTMKLLKGHSERVTGVSFREGSTSEMTLLASSSADGTVRLWQIPHTSTNYSSSSSSSSSPPILPSVTMRGASSSVVSAVCMLPLMNQETCGICTANANCTWSLWDAIVQKELLNQDGFV